MVFDRRTFLRGSLATAAITGLSGLALADAPTEKRLVVVILRGALDGLSAIPPVGDPSYAGLRGDLTITAPLPLDGFFGLHPAMAAMGDWYARGELLPIHAVATPYRERSHFDAQDLLENGTGRPRSETSGWLNRTLATFTGGGRLGGLAVGQAVPLILRGDEPVATWSPSVLPSAESDLLDRLGAMYAADPLFSQNLIEAMETNALVGGDGGGMGAGSGARAQLREAVRTAATMMATADGPRIAVLESTGWDTHANQGADQGRLANTLSGLADALELFRDTIGDVWSETAMLVVTEFGRTAVPNGTRGTDHGTGAAALLAGGAVAGGRVLSDWPGLAAHQLHEGRDLMPTTDLRAILKGVLRDHLHVSEQSLETIVFPDSAPVRPIDGLIG